MKNVARATSTAERSAVDRGDDRLAALLDDVDDLRQPRVLRRLAELGDVGARKESAAIAANDDGFHSVVGDTSFDRVLESGSHGLAERIDRRIIRGHDKDFAIAAGGNRASHRVSPQARLLVSAE